MNRSLRVLAGLSLFLTSAAVQADWIYVTPSQPRMIVNQPVFVSHHVVVNRPIVISRPVIVVERPVYVTEPVYVTAPVYVEPICYEPAVVSRPVFVPRPVVTQSWVGQPYAVREQVDVRRHKVEYEQKGKFQAFDGRRMKTYRYEYEVQERPSGTRYKFDIDD